MKTATLSCTIFALMICAATSNAGVAVNVIYRNSGTSFDEDAGILSTPGGNFWNDGVFFGDRPLTMANLFDEFNAPTATDLVLLLDTDEITGASATSFGASSAGVKTGAMEFRDLILGSSYDLAIYVTNDIFTDPLDTFEVVGGSGPTSQSSTGEDPISGLPGVAGRDYLLFSGVTAFDLGGGTAGIRINGLSGRFTGLQLSGEFAEPAVVPEPNSLAAWAGLIATGVIVQRLRRRQSV